MKAQHLAIRADDKEHPSQRRALQHRTRNRPQRLPRLGSQRRRTLKPHKAEQGQHHTQPHSHRRHSAKPQLLLIDTQSMLPKQNPHHKTDQAHRHRFNPQHRLRRNLHIPPRNPHRPTRAHSRQQPRRNMRPKPPQKHIRIAHETANHRSRRHHISKEQRPRSHRSKRRRQRLSRVNIQRPRRSRVPRKHRDTQRHQRNSCHGKRIRQPRAIPRQRKHQRNRQRRRSTRSHSRDRLRQRLQRRQHTPPQPIRSRNDRNLLVR